jgi:hypothetical protein
MKTRFAVLAAATVFVLASAAFAQETRQEGPRSAPQAQQVPDQPEIPTRTAAPSSRQGELPQTTTYTNPPAPPVAVQAPPPVEVQVPVEPAPAPLVAETTTTEYEELPGSASPYPSLALGGLALIAAGVVIRRKSR